MAGAEREEFLLFLTEPYLFKPAKGSVQFKNYLFTVR